MFEQEFFTDTDALRRNFDQFVVIDKFQRLFQRQLDGFSQYQVFIGAGARILVNCLALSGLTTRSLARLCMPTTIPS